MFNRKKEIETLKKHIKLLNERVTDLEEVVENLGKGVVSTATEVANLKDIYEPVKVVTSFGKKV